jgi:hypothetical protein
MRKIIVVAHLSSDGVLQGPGRADEDTSGGFTQGGWISRYADEELGKVIRNEMNTPFDLP